MGFTQRLGGPAQIDTMVTRDQFMAVVDFFNHAFELYRKSSIINCTCYDDSYESADPDCTICEGTGSIKGWTKEAINSFLGIIFVNPEYNQDQHQRLYTKSGPVDTMDARMFVDGSWYNSIHKEDIIIARYPEATTGIEFNVISTVPRYGQGNEVIFVRCDLERPITRMVSKAENIVGSL